MSLLQLKNSKQKGFFSSERERCWWEITCSSLMGKISPGMSETTADGNGRLPPQFLCGNSRRLLNNSSQRKILRQEGVFDIVLQAVCDDDQQSPTHSPTTTTTKQRQNADAKSIQFAIDSYVFCLPISDRSLVLICSSYTRQEMNRNMFLNNISQIESFSKGKSERKISKLR